MYRSENVLKDKVVIRKCILRNDELTIPNGKLVYISNVNAIYPHYFGNYRHECNEVARRRVRSFLGTSTEYLLMCTSVVLGVHRVPALVYHRNCAQASVYNWDEY